MYNTGHMNDVGKTIASALFLAAVVGCGTVRNAREVQARLVPMGSGQEAAEWVAPKVDLKGAPLRALVEFAFTNRPSMTAALIEVRDARLALKEIAADAPLASSTPWNAADLSANMGYSESSDRAKLEDLGHTRKSRATGGLSLDVLIYDFGRNSARARAQAEKVVAAEMALVQQGYTVFAEVAGSYFSLLQNEALFEIACTNELEYLEHLRQAEDKLSLGEAKELDVLKARLDLSKSRQDIVSASNNVVTAGADLMAAMGIDTSTGDATAVVGTKIGGLSRVLRALPTSSETAAEAFDFASTNAPAMKIVRAKLRAASAEVDYAVANLMPNVSANVSLSWTDPLWYWSWGVNAVQSLFTGFRKTTAVDRAVLALEAAAASVDHEEQQLSYDLALAIAERDNALEACRTARESVHEARENLKMVKSQYEVGDVSRVEFTDAVSELARAWGDRIKAYYRGQNAEARLFQLMGSDPVYLMEEWLTEE